MSEEKRMELDVSRDENGLTAYRRQRLTQLHAQLSSASSKAAFGRDDAGQLTLPNFLKLCGQEKKLGELPIDKFMAAVGDASPVKYDNRLRFDLTPEAITSLAEEVMKATRDASDAVASVPDGKHTFANTIQVLAADDQVGAALYTTVDFMAHVSPDKPTRDASTEADKRMSAFHVEESMRVDVYDAVVKFSNTDEAKSLVGEEARMLEHTLRDFRRNGLHLDEAKRDSISRIKKRMSELGIQFQRNLSEDNTKLPFAEEQLAGIPADNVNKLEKDEQGRRLMTLNYPDFFPAMKYCSVPETRRQLEFAFNSRCLKENSEILEELVQLRAQRAAILGLPTHAAFVLDIRMAKTPETVIEFLTSLSQKLDPLLQSDLKVLLALKEEECKSMGVEFDGKVNMWDYHYYMRVREEREFQVNHEEIKEYFPLDVVTDGLLNIYQDLLRLRFTKIDDAHVWHPDVTMYSVHDSQTNDFMGHFYLDLFPRDGKYNHAACFPLDYSAEILRDPTPQKLREFPVAAMVSNFSKPTDDKPSLLTHNEVVTYFHEFGHVMHNICSHVRFVRFAGTRVERDFVEAPSQMLENWCWKRESLLLMSGHYQDKSKKLPDELLDKLVAAKNANAGFLNKRQIVFGIFDQQIHTHERVNTAEMFASVLKDVMGLEATPGTNFAANFAHLAGGYDASYYGYMWSEVYSADMFYSRFVSQGLMSQAVGLDYRFKILAVGSTRDSFESLEDFLGRKPQQEAFLTSKGL